MDDSKFLALNKLFDAIGIVEKGIEKIYHHLLVHKRIENLKEVAHTYNLSLKRGYKISSVLSDLELVQVFDRPMKIHLSSPVIPVWQKIINERIQELKNKFEEDKQTCENALEEFIESYSLEEQQASVEPVEFINYDLDNFEEVYYPFFAKEDCKMAIGIRYENLLISLIKGDSLEKIPEKNKKLILDGIGKFVDNLQKIDVQVIFNSDIITTLLNGKDFEILTQILEPIKPEFKNLKIRITEADFSNFSLIDSNELIQPSFDPTNKLMGAYISRNRNIFQIFSEKFEELFTQGLPIEVYLENAKEVKYESLSEVQYFALCLL